MVKLKIGGLDGLGKALVKSNIGMFEDEFQDGIDRGFTKAQMIDMIEGTFLSAAESELSYGYDVVHNEGLDAYDALATLGFQNYEKSKIPRMHASTLVDANMPKTGKSRNANVGSSKKKAGTRRRRCRRSR